MAQGSVRWPWTGLQEIILNGEMMLEQQTLRAEDCHRQATRYTNKLLPAGVEGSLRDRAVELISRKALERLWGSFADYIRA